MLWKKRYIFHHIGISNLWVSKVMGDTPRPQASWIQSFDKMDDDWGYPPFTEARRLGRPFEKKRGWLGKAHFLC